jgi:hypothetical protein
VESASSIRPDEPPPAPTATLASTADAAAPAPHVPPTPTAILAGHGEASKSPAPASSIRPVQFVLHPSGADLAVDGVERAWWGAEMQLSVGVHAVEARPRDARCCKKTSGQVTVLPAPADKPSALQTIHVNLDLNDAAVSLAANAPMGAQLYCSDIGLTVPAGKTVLTKLRQVEWMGTCSFVAPERPPRVRSVTLRAGDSRALDWPE